MFSESRTVLPACPSRLGNANEDRQKAQFCFHLLNAADLSAKTISFFANQFDIPRETFRAFRNPANHWTL